MGSRIQSIAATCFALMFVALMALMQTNVLSIGNNVNDQLHRTNVNTEIHELAAFDDTTVTGATVISAIKNYQTLYRYDMTIVVKTKANAAGTSYGAGQANPDYTVTSPSNARYINPTKSFTATLKPNANGVLTTIEFVEI